MQRGSTFSYPARFSYGGPFRVPQIFLFSYENEFENRQRLELINIGRQKTGRTSSRTYKGFSRRSDHGTCFQSPSLIKSSNLITFPSPLSHWSILLSYWVVNRSAIYKFFSLSTLVHYWHATRSYAPKTPLHQNSITVVAHFDHKCLDFQSPWSSL